MSSPFNTTTSRFRSFCLTNEDRPSSSFLDRERLDRIPDSHAAIDATNDQVSRTRDTAVLNSEPKLLCCCGRPDCAYLEHNNAALGGIEKDLETAARLGQALLTRHESYITESQLEHARLTSQVEELETDRNSLQTANEKIVAENRELLAKLESLNTSLSSSDSQVKNLEDLLRDCESEVERLNALALRTEELELRVLDMESERIVLARKLEDGEEESRTMLKRWRDSERKVKELELDVQKIEWEAKMELEKHEEVVARLERERTLERELGGAEGRLKGAAALQNINGGTSNPAVVSNFVRDILKDNANLQAGIVELRDLLQNSNEEVQNLREQILQHQPVENTDSDLQVSRSVPLDEQLGWQSPTPQPTQREVHVHHHYHAKIAPKKERTPSVRRSSRKRAFVGSGAPATPTQLSSPPTPVPGPQRFMSSPSVPIHIHQPRPMKNRWSVQSGATGTSAVSSLPSSPRSYYERNNSIFDRMEFMEDSSRPTSPESAAGLVSPRHGNRETKGLQIEQPTLDSFHEQDEDRAKVPIIVPIQNPDQDIARELTPKIVDADEMSVTNELTPKPPQVLYVQDDTSVDPLEPRPPDLGPEVRNTLEKTNEEPVKEDVTLPSALSQIPEIRPTLRRSNSHDSILSVSGMDVHLAQRPPGASPFTLLRGNSAHFAMSPAQSRKIAVSQPLASVTEFTAIGNAKRSTAIKDLNTSMLALSGIVKDHATSPVVQQQSGFGRFGGWMRGKWGVAPMASTSDLRAANLQPRRQSSGSGSGSGGGGGKTLQNGGRPPLSTLPLSSPSVNEQNDRLGSFAGRMPGINQKGAIPGLWVQNMQTPSKIQSNVVDEDGLREGLAEG